MKKDWTYKKLGEVAEIYQPKTISGKELITNGTYPVYGANGIIGRYDKYNHSESELLVGCRGTCGRVTESIPNAWINGNAMVVHLKNDFTLLLTKKYLFYALKGIDYTKVITGGTIPQITRQNLAPISIPVPPISIQESIVRELDLLHSVIEKKKEQLRELDNLAQSLFYQMFGDPITNPMGWEIKKLGEVGNFARGVSKHRPRNAPELLGGDMPLIQTGDISNSGIYIQQYTQTYSELGVTQSKIWEPGTLCITIAANIGKASILTFKACFPDSIVGFQANHDIAEILYMYFVFSFLQSILEENAPAVAQKNINLQILSQVKIPLPPLSLQQSFAAKVSAIEAQKQAITQSIHHTEALLAQRMDNYFG